MPFAIQELQSAYKAYRQFLERGAHPHHARFVFPFFKGSYFVYRKVDVARVVAVSRSISSNPSYVDVGCGYGDFLARIRQHLPDAVGIEKEGGIFYSFQVPKPDYISLMPAEGLTQEVDTAFVGWMEPGQDFRGHVARIAKCVITTFDAGGQCGINGGCEYEEFGFQRVAWWRTPSWIDVNAELMNRHYTPGLADEKKVQLAGLRSAHNFWYVYAKPEFVTATASGLKSWLGREDASDRYDFESVLDECGFGYMQELPALTTSNKLWEVIFE
ncbi:MAG: tRNA (guanine-N(7)-)-methyltransferase [Nitrososphaera sp.]|nr:tRNA (guanine-N(7)-)-methyltransferase [Nitrososphaera sp.]